MTVRSLTSGRWSWELRRLELRLRTDPGRDAAREVARDARCEGRRERAPSLASRPTMETRLRTDAAQRKIDAGSPLLLCNGNASTACPVDRSRRTWWRRRTRSPRATGTTPGGTRRAAAPSAAPRTGASCRPPCAGSRPPPAARECKQGPTLLCAARPPPAPPWHAPPSTHRMPHLLAALDLLPHERQLLACLEVPRLAPHAPRPLQGVAHKAAPSHPWTPCCTACWHPGLTPPAQHAHWSDRAWSRSTSTPTHLDEPSSKVLLKVHHHVLELLHQLLVLLLLLPPLDNHAPAPATHGTAAAPPCALGHAWRLHAAQAVPCQGTPAQAQELCCQGAVLPASRKQSSARTRTRPPPAPRVAGPGARRSARAGPAPPGSS